MSGAPGIETQRLVIRGHGLDDFDDSAAMGADPEVVRYLGGQTYTRPEAWGRIMRYAGGWALLGYGYWVVRARDDGRFLGEAGFTGARRELGPAFDDFPEAGWAFARAAQGQGFAAEALSAILAWGDARFARTVCMIEPENLASVRLAQRLGYAPFDTARYRDAELVLFERPARAAA